MSEKVKKLKKNKQKNEEISEHTESPKKRKSKVKTQDNEKKSVKFSAETVDNEVEGNPSPKKKRKQQESESDPQELAPLSEELEAEINRPENVKNVASKRAQKREKYEKLKADNKLKSETQMQQRALNYLSLWKHNKQEWKFEKIKQVWIQTHMFDSARVPDEFWDTTIQYFGGSKGKIRQFLIDGCMKIIDEADKEDKADKDDEEETDVTEETKYKRARELLQHLQE